MVQFLVQICDLIVDLPRKELNFFFTIEVLERFHHISRVLTFVAAGQAD